MKYSVDKIEDDIVVLENLKTKEIFNVNISLFDGDINEKDIVILKNNKYQKQVAETNDRLKRLRQLMNKLKNS